MKILWRASLRFGVRLAAWVLFFALVSQILLWVALRNDWRLRMPGFALQFVLDRLEESGIEVRCSDVYVRPTGVLEAESLDMCARGGDSPNFTVRHVAASVSLPALLKGKFVPKRAVLEGGVFYCPPSVSPDGRRRVVLEDVRALLELAPDGWLHVNTVQGRYGAMPIVMRGEFLPGARKRKRTLEPPSLTPEKWRAINFIAAQLLEIRPKFETFGRFSLEVNGSRIEENNENGAVLFNITARGEDFRLPGLDKARAHGVQLACDSLFDGSRFRPSGPVVLSARGFEWVLPPDAEFAPENATEPPTLRAGDVRFSVVPGAKWHFPSSMEFAACDVTMAGERMDYLDGFLDWSGLPMLLSARLRATSGTDTLFATAKGNPILRTLEASFATRVTPARFLEHPAVRANLPERLASLAIHHPVHLSGNVRLGAGLRFKELRAHLDAGAATYEDFEVAGASADVHLTPAGIEVSNADVRAANYRAMGGFRTGFGEGDEFRFLLRGSTHPGYLGRFLGPFWVELWEQFSLRDDSLPRADIEIRGNWGVKHEFIYCGAAGENLAFRGAAFDKASLRIHESPDCIALYDMRAWQGERSATGTFQLHYIPPPVHERESFRFRFEGDFPKETSALLGGAELHDLLRPVVSDDPVSPVRTTVTGYVHSWASPTPERVQVVVAVDAPGNTVAWRLPFNNFKGSVAYDTGQAVITVDDATFARGSLGQNPAPWSSSRPVDRPQRAWLDLRPSSPTLHLDLELLGARRDSLVEAVKSLAKVKDDPVATPRLATPSAPVPAAGVAAPALPMPVGTAGAGATDPPPAAKGGTLAALAAPGAPAAPPEAPAAPAAPPDNSSVDIVFVGGITLPHLDTLDGSGSVRFWDPELPNLRLFLGFSRVLEKIGIRASTFNIEHAQGDFTVRRMGVYFPMLKITGKNALIECVGNYGIETDALDFRASFTAKVAQNIPGVKEAMSVLYKWTKLVPVSITGTLDKPEWKLDPTLFRPVLDPAKGRASD
ncbi:MAG: hypothetical protein LBG65_03270 [Puniceicoccales bacterium]|nr:hypothetical protein [Puniceicoccales bacterium]